MELQQLSNLINRILKQSVGLQHICREDFILNMKGMQYPFFIFFFCFEILQYSAEPAIYSQVFFV